MDWPALQGWGGIDAESSLKCVPKQHGSSSAAGERQRQRDLREQQRARDSARNITANLVATGREASTEHGRALFRKHAEQVSVGLGLLLEELLANPHRAGQHLSCWPLLLLVNRGPRSVALLALSVVIDSISQPQPLTKLAGAIGREIADEVKALRVEQQRGVAMLRLVRRRLGARALSDPKVLRQLHLSANGWDAEQRREIGLLLLNVIETHTDLVVVRTTTHRGRRQRLVEASPAALAVIEANPPRPLPARRLPLLVPPRDWPGMTGGGHDGDQQALVHSRAGHDLSYLDTTALAPVLQAVNTLQRQQLLIDPWMVEQQRIAWDSNIGGLFPCRREPLPSPPRPREHIGAEAWAAWQRQAVLARRDQFEGASHRQRIETTLQLCEEVAGQPVWFSHFADFRGRLFTSNRYATHQGPDWEKAAVLFAQGERCSVEAFEWLLRAAAGHWGETSSWDDRLRWGQGHLPELVAAAEAPLDRLELWRDAKDPWQFLQLCRAIAQQVAEPDSACQVPIRFDQTCSGVGISAMLLRDRRLARLTNCWGSTRQDIYQHVAEQLQHKLRLDLSNGDRRSKQLAHFWLEFGIDRSLLKGPVMTTIYGARFLGIMEGLAATLNERSPVLPVGQWRGEQLDPSAYLARQINELLQAELGSCLALQAWLKATCKAVVSRERVLRWTSPSGLPVELGQQLDSRRTITSHTRGQRRWRTTGDAQTGKERELSARQTATSLAANFIHSFDAAMAHAVVGACGEHRTPLLTNHDCFATNPARAGWLHQRLHDGLRTLYAPDWLGEIAAEIGRANRDLAIPPPPKVRDLCTGEIGQNPYAFS